jgi:hypothetical protein
MQLPPLRAFVSLVDYFFKPCIYNRYTNTDEWRQRRSSSPSPWKSQRSSTNEQNTFHLFPTAWNSLSYRYKSIGDSRESI